MTDDLKLTECFIKCQQHRHLCWQATIAKKHRVALEEARKLAASALELRAILERKAKA